MSVFQRYEGIVLIATIREDLNALVKRHIQSLISSTPSKALATLEKDATELIANGMVTLNAKLAGIEDENKLVSRVVEIWGFFWVQVLPYVEGVSAAADISLPLMMQFGIGAPSSANRSNDILPISDAKGPQTLVA